MTRQKFCFSGRRVIETEARAIVGLANQLGPSFEEACRVSGLGKSGHIGKR